MEPGQVEPVAEYADILQIGARNMQNYSLLMAVGKTGRPVLLKRGLSGTIEEWLMAAEYVMSSGNPNVILCERGIRTFETATRNTLDIAAVPLLHELTRLPVIIDPSHATGKRWLVAPLSLAAAAIGADGLLIEVHPRPEEALSDGDQSVTLDQFAALVAAARPVHAQAAPLHAPRGGGDRAAAGRMERSGLRVDRPGGRDERGELVQRHGLVPVGECLFRARVDLDQEAICPDRGRCQRERRHQPALAGCVRRVDDHGQVRQ